jgi:hypothetical protein
MQKAEFCIPGIYWIRIISLFSRSLLSSVSFEC